VFYGIVHLKQYGDVSEINKFELIDNYSGITCYVYDTYMVGIYSSGKELVV
jgi:hypothetical protein